MTTFLRLVLVAIAAWIAGSAAYVVVLSFVYGDSWSWGDAAAVAFWSALAFASTFFVLYLPALRAIRRKMRGVHPWWPFPVVAAAIGVIPVALIAVANGGSLRAMASPEALLFGVMFGVIGIVVGTGFAQAYRHVPVDEGRDP